MRAPAPATAALVLAALSALPCRGTDTEAGSFPIEPSAGSQPTLNRFYQMLHSGNTTHYDTTTSIQHYSFYEHFTNDILLRKTKEHGSINIRTAKDEPLISRGNQNRRTTKDIDNRDDTSQKDYTRGKDSIDHSIYTENASDIDSIDRNAQEKLEIIKSRSRRVVSVMRSDETSTVAVTSPPLMMERRKKPGETGSSAPLLNYIFDTYSNTHQHHNRNEKERPKTGIYAAAAPEIEALVGSTAHLDCKVDALHDKLVSWVRRKNEDDPMELLYTGTQQYTADDRYSSRFIPPDIWRLEVREVRPSDAAHYDCQVPTHPPRTARLTLTVPEVSVRIVDGAGAAVNEQVCEVGSTVALRCEVRGLRMEGGPSLLWYRKEDLLNDDTTRGGISVRTEFGPNGANSVLRVARVKGEDAGRYTCTVARAPPPAPPPAHVLLHVIKGESLAELHQGGSPPTPTDEVTLTLSVLLHVYYILYYNIDF